MSAVQTFALRCDGYRCRREVFTTAIYVADKRMDYVPIDVVRAEAERAGWVAVPASAPAPAGVRRHLDLCPRCAKIRECPPPPAHRASASRAAGSSRGSSSKPRRGRTRS